MTKEEQTVTNFAKKHDLINLDFSWGTNTDRYYFAYNQQGEEVHIHYKTETNEITSRVA